MIGVGAMIGAGIFVLTGIAAGHAGPALILVFALNGLVALISAMSYAELGSCFPEAGGGYLWIKEGLPQPNGFLSGWMSWFAHAVACSLYAVAFRAFCTDFVIRCGLHVDQIAPVRALADALHWTPHDLTAKALAVAVTGVFTYINYRGAEETGKAEVARRRPARRRRWSRCSSSRSSPCSWRSALPMGRATRRRGARSSRPSLQRATCTANPSGSASWRRWG